MALNKRGVAALPGVGSVKQSGEGQKAQRLTAFYACIGWNQNQSAGVAGRTEYP